MTASLDKLLRQYHFQQASYVHFLPVVVVEDASYCNDFLRTPPLCLMVAAVIVSIQCYFFSFDYCGDVDLAKGSDAGLNRPRQ